MARPIWTGSINFGLVSIPVEMIVAVHEQSVHFHMLSKDGGCRLRRKLVCPDTGKEYDFNQTARGIEVGPDNYVLIDQREVDRLKPEKGRSLDIVQFIEPHEVDPIYFDHVYYLNPGKDAKKAYKLLAAAMQESRKCAVGRFVMREKQYTALIRVKGEGLVLHTLHYADEVDQIEEDASSASAQIKLSSGEMRMAGELIKAMTHELHLDEFKDEFRLQLQAMVDAKAHGKEITHAPEDNARPAAQTINLMDALKKSLADGATRQNGHAVRRVGNHNGTSNGHNGHYRQIKPRRRRSA